MLTLGNITFACQDPSRLANFWAAALAYSVEKLPPELVDLLVAEGKDMNMAAAISDPSGKGPRMFFEKKLKSQTAVLPIHLDLRSDDAAAEIVRLVSLGATEVGMGTQQLGPHKNQWMVMKDPEGNGFCVQF